MLTVNEKLSLIQQARDDIKTSLENKGQTVNTDIRTYADAIDSIKTSEDLKEQLDAQDTVIQQLQAELAGKSSGGGITPNVFLQPNEPSIKEGIWLQDDTLTFDNIAFDADISGEENWDITNDYGSLPYSFYDGAIISIDNDIYLFGGASSTKVTYKYNTVTKQFTKLSDIPVAFFEHTATLVGTNVYLIGGRLNNPVYKYDTLTDTYTALTSLPSNLRFVSATAIGTNIYIFGNNGNNGNYIYKYDTLANTFTKMTALTPAAVRYHITASVGKNIYIFYGTNTYKYDTINDTCVSLSTSPLTFNGGGIASIGANIYLFEGYSVYKYDTLTDTFTQLEDGSLNLVRSHTVTINNNQIYILGGANTQQKIKVFSINTKTYEDNSILISQSAGDYATQLVSMPRTTGRMLFHFYDAWHYTQANGLSKTIPTYYGNGTEWVKFKN